VGGHCRLSFDFECLLVGGCFLNTFENWRLFEVFQWFKWQGLGVFGAFGACPCLCWCLASSFSFSSFL